MNQPNQTMITVDGKTTLSGTLNFQTDPSANLSAGQTFHFLASPTISAGFDSVTGLYAGGQLVYDVTQNTSTITFTVASETTSPQVFGINPSAGPAATEVTVFGSDLLGTSAVRFGAKPASSFTVVSSTELTALTPAGIANGTSAPVTVVTPNGTSPSIGAPTFTYAGNPSGSAGSASLHLTLRDRVGNGLPGVTVSVSDELTHNPLGLVVTGTNGSGTFTGLSKGGAVRADVVGTLAPYGAASAVYQLSAGVNSKILTLPIQPLVTSDPTAIGPDGNPQAVWPQIAPKPGTTIPGGGSLSSPRTLGDIEFTLQYTAGSKFILSADSLGTQPFCVDGKWTLTLSGPAPSTNVVTDSGSGCPASGAPINIGTTLGLAPGTYGGEFKAIAPAGATTAGSTDIYLLPPAGKLTDLRVTPGQVVAHAQLGGSDTSVVGANSKLNATLGGFPIPGAQVYDVTFSYDPAGISVTSRDYPARWGVARQPGSFPNGIGVFYETNRGYPIPIGGTVATLEVTCNEAGIWPVSYAGNYAVPGVNTSYITLAVEGSGVVICNPPPPAANTLANGVRIDPATGDVSATVTGSDFGAATRAQLLTPTGSVESTSTTVANADTVVTADFPPTTPGMYSLKLLDAHGGVVAQTGSASLEVAPALPLMSPEASDVVGDVPGIATTHSYSLSNAGTVNGVAILAFSFPSYITTEPLLNMQYAPPGSRLLLHGMTAGGWAEYVAVPVAVGFSDSLSWTYTVPPDAVYGPHPSIGVSQPIEVVPALAGEYTAPEWPAEAAKTNQQIVDSAMAQGMNDYSAAFTQVLAMGAASNGYLMNLADQPLADALTCVGQSILGKVASRESDLTGQQQVVAPPSTKSVPTPPPASTASQPADSLNDPAATSFANFSFNTGVAMVAGYGANNPVPANGQPPQVSVSGTNGASSVVGTVNSYKDGVLGPVVSLSNAAPGTAEGSAALSASWNASPNVDTTSWASGIRPAVTLAGPSGPITAAALPFQEVYREQLGFATAGGGVGVARSDRRDVVGGVASGLVREQSTLVGHVYVSDPAGSPSSGRARHNDACGGCSNNISQYNSAPSFGTGWSIVSNAFPSGAGLAVSIGFGVLGLVTGGFVVGVVCGVGAELLGGVLQMMVQYANTSGVPNGVNAGHALTSSLDPNDIQAQPVGRGSKSWIASQPITYTVRFFNEPKATAPAFNVVVKLPLDPNLDPSSVQPGVSSFAGTQFAYDPDTNIVTWILPNIDLPPDTSPPNGEASVSFSASPRKGLKTGTAIHESAQVLFDYNPPISTASVLSTIDATPPTISHLTASRRGNVVGLNWKTSGRVPISGSQIDISVDGGPLVPLVQTKRTTFKFHGAAGHTYGFAVQTQDMGGLTSSSPAFAVLTSCPTKPSKTLVCAGLANGRWAGLTVPGHAKGKLSISVRGKGTLPKDMVVENTPCPSNGLKDAVCFRFSAYSSSTGLQVQRLGQPLAFTSVKPVYIYAKNGTFATLRHSSKSEPLTVGSNPYMWVP